MLAEAHVGLDAGLRPPQPALLEPLDLDTQLGADLDVDQDGAAPTVESRTEQVGRGAVVAPFQRLLTGRRELLETVRVDVLRRDVQQVPTRSSGQYLLP